MIDGRAVLAFASSLPNLELLELTGYEGASGSGWKPSSRAATDRLLRLTHLSILVTGVNAGWMTRLAGCEMPELKNVYVCGTSEHALGAVAPFFTPHGYNLTSLVIAFPGSSMGDRQQPDIIQHCSNLQELVMDLPTVSPTFPGSPYILLPRALQRQGIPLRQPRSDLPKPLPTLPHLRVLAGRGVLSPSNSHYHNVLPFLSKFTMETTPGFKIIKIIDLQTAQRDAAVAAQIIALHDISKDPRRITFQNTMGHDITLPEVITDQHVNDEETA